MKPKKHKAPSVEQQLDKPKGLFIKSQHLTPEAPTSATMAQATGEKARLYNQVASKCAQIYLEHSREDGTRTALRIIEVIKNAMERFKLKGDLIAITSASKVTDTLRSEDKMSYEICNFFMSCIPKNVATN